MRFVMNWTSPEDQGGAYNPERRRRSSVVEQPPCKRQVVCSIQTGGTNPQGQRAVPHRGVTAAGADAVLTGSAHCGQGGVTRLRRQQPYQCIRPAAARSKVQVTVRERTTPEAYPGSGKNVMNSRTAVMTAADVRYKAGASVPSDQ